MFFDLMMEISIIKLNTIYKLVGYCKKYFTKKPLTFSESNVILIARGNNGKSDTERINETRIAIKGDFR